MFLKSPEKLISTVRGAGHLTGLKMGFAALPRAG
jgi:hypothetical protein